MKKEMGETKELDKTNLNDRTENNTYRFETLAQMYEYDKTIGIEDKTYIIIANMEEDDKVKIGGKFYTPDPKIIDLQSMSLKKITNRQWLDSLSDEEYVEEIVLSICCHCIYNNKRKGCKTHDCKEGILRRLQAEHKE